MLRGVLWDVSATGAKILFENEDYRPARPVLAETLRTGRLLQLTIDGAPAPIGAFLVWYGVAPGHGFAIGVEIAAADALDVPIMGDGPRGLRLVGVHHRESRQARLALSLRDLFLSISEAEFSLDSALALLCEKVRALTGAEGVTFWALEGTQSVLRAQAGRSRIDTGEELPEAPHIPPFAVLKEAARRHHQLFANEAEHSPFAAHPGVERFGLRSIMIIPVYGREVDFGMLIFGHSGDPYAFGAQEQTEAEIFANQAALFFEKAQLLEKFRHAAGFLAAMNRIALAFHSELDVDRVLDVICRESRELFRVDLTTLFLRENGGYVQRAAAGMALTTERIGSGEAAVPEGMLVERGEAFFLNEFDTSEIARTDIVKRFMGSRSVRSIMVIPIRDRDQILGTLSFADRQNPRRFGSEDLEMGKLLGEQAARALVNARLYERVAQSKRILRQQDRFRILGELAGVVSHEIKNALVPLRTLVELLPQRFDDGDFREWFARTVAQEVDRMHSLVLQLSRFRASGQPNAEPTNPSELVTSVVELVRPEARSREITIEVEAPPLPPVSLVANEIRQVLLNLLLNALQAVEERGTIRVSVDRDAGGTTRFRVADDGPGIAADRLERIFDALYTTKSSGSGLGLAIAKDLVQGRGGTIQVESEPGQGAIFTVSFPSAGATVSAPTVH